MEKVLKYNVLISCPGDVEEKKYVKAAKNAIKEFNEIHSATYKVYLKHVYWKDDTFPEYGDAPQNLINKQIVDSTDLTIAVFYARWGQKTENYGSATEEEIKRTINMKKNVFLYFVEVKESPDKFDVKQYSKIKNFKEEYAKSGIYVDVNDNTAKFKKKLLSDLKGFFNTQKHENDFRLNLDWDHVINRYEIYYKYLDKERTLILCKKTYEVNALINDYQFLTDRYGWQKGSKIISVKGGKLIDIQDENNPYRACTIKLDKALKQGQNAEIVIEIQLDNSKEEDPCYLSYSPNVPIKQLELKVAYDFPSDIKEAKYEVIEGISGRSASEEGILEVKNNEVVHVFTELSNMKRYQLTWEFWN